MLIQYYLKALVNGLPPTPHIPNSVRAEIQERLIREGSESLHSELVARGDKIANHLALPPVKIHCSILAEDAIKAAIDDYKKKNRKNR